MKVPYLISAVEAVVAALVHVHSSVKRATEKQGKAFWTIKPGRS